MLASALKEDNDTTGAMLMEIDQSLKLIETLEARKQKLLMEKLFLMVMD